MFSDVLLKHLIFFLRRTSMHSTSVTNLPFPTPSSFFERLGSAVFYGACSGLITIVNKLVLTSYAYVLLCFTFVQNSSSSII